MTEFYGEWQGSAKKLLGDNLILVVFVSPPNNIWTREQKDENLKEIQKGIDWIIQQAQTYDIQPNIKVMPLQLEKDFLLNDKKDGLNLQDNLQDLSKALGFVNFSHILSHFRTEYRGHNVAMIFAVNISNEKGGTAHATSHGEFEYAALYPDARYNNLLSPFMVAHELLHNYSAPDLYAYNENPAGQKAQENAKKYVRKDIMLCEVEGEEFEISEYTAFTVGWHNNPKDWYMDITPPDYNQSIRFLMNYSEFFDDSAVLITENASKGRVYKFEYGEIIEWFFEGNLSLWTFEEDGEDAYIASVLMPENNIQDDFIFIKNASYALQMPLQDGKAKVYAGDNWQDWYDVTLENVTITVHYENGFLKQYTILDKIHWYWEENNEGKNLSGIFKQYNETDTHYAIKNETYKFKIPKDGGMAQMSYTEYNEKEWMDWYKVTVSYFDKV